MVWCYQLDFNWLFNSIPLFQACNRQIPTVKHENWHMGFWWLMTRCKNCYGSFFVIMFKVFQKQSLWQESTGLESVCAFSSFIARMTNYSHKNFHTFLKWLQVWNVGMQINLHKWQPVLISFVQHIRMDHWWLFSYYCVFLFLYFYFVFSYDVVVMEYLSTTVVLLFRSTM